MSKRNEHIRSIASAVWRRGRDALLLLAVLLAFVIGYSLAAGGGGPAAAQRAGDAAASERPTLYTCSMHPEVRMPNPDDLCPICGMGLVPVSEAGSDAGGSGDADRPPMLRLSEAALARLRVETTPVTRRWIDHRIAMVGEIAYDETKLSYITAYAPGRLDRLFVDYEGMTVRKGDHLAEIYSPELLVAQRELIEAKRSLDRLAPQAGATAREAARSLANAARERLRLLGMTPEQIETTETAGELDDHVTLFAPTGGVVAELHARRGSYVDEGDRIVTLADLSEVWVQLEAYESDLPWLRYGQDVTFTTEAHGDRAFEGRIVFIAPTLNPQRRTVRVRVNAANPDGRLKPGMFVRAEATASAAASGRVLAPELEGKWVSPMHPEVIRDEPGPCPVCGMDLVRAEELGYSALSKADADPPLAVPSSAVLRTGERGIVYVETERDGAGRVFEPREVELGPRGEGFFVVLDGLVEGEVVVSRGNFQIDAELQIRGERSMMSATASASTDAPTRPMVTGDAGEALAALWRRYHALSEALASDDAEAARVAAGKLESTLRIVDQAELPVRVERLWQEQHEAMTQAVARAERTDDIAAMRESFQPISQAIMAVLGGVRVEGVGPLYEAHCPMAFDFAGASWLSPDRAIRNPYFGDEMYTCGTIRETVMPAVVPESDDHGDGKPASHDSEDHADHSHG